VVLHELVGYDIVAIYETWCEDNIIDVLENYICYSVKAKRYSKYGRASGGIALYIKGKYGRGVTRICDNFMLAVIVKLNADVIGLAYDIILVCAYIPPEGSVAYECNDENGIELLSDKIRELKATYPSHCVFLLGDLNSRIGKRQDWIDDSTKDMPYMDWYNSDPFQLPRKSKDNTVNKFGVSLLDLCIEHEIHVLNGRFGSDIKGEYTFIREGGHSVIDYMIAPLCLYDCLTDFYVHTLDVSGHFPLVCKIKRMNCLHDEKKVSQMATKTVYGFKWNCETREQFMRNVVAKAAQLKEVNEFCDQYSQDVNSQYSKLVEYITECGKFMSYVRGKSRKPLSDYVTQPPWWDKDCANAKHVKYNLLRQFRRNNCDVTLHAYVLRKKQFKQLCEEKKDMYAKEMYTKLQHSYNDPATFWKLVKSIDKKPKKVPHIQPDMWYNHFKQLLNTYVMRDKCFEEHVDKTIDNHDINCILCEQNAPLCLNAPICENELMKCINEMPSGKSPGEDGITYEMLKVCVRNVGDILLKLFNNVLTTGKVPRNWCKGMLLPLHKSGSYENPHNYRGISLIPVICKIFTKLLNNRLVAYVKENNLVSEEQAAYRKGYGTIDQIFVLQSIVQKYLCKKKGRFYVIFIDFAKCFDSISHKHLVYKLLQSGIHGNVLQVIRDLYEKLESCVKTQDGTTQYFECKVGTRQGCILSPTLFSIFINELVNMMKEYDCQGVYVDEEASNIVALMYADDVAEGGDTVIRLQNTIDVLEKFCDKWGLNVNTKKTKIVVFRAGGVLKTVEKWFFKNQPLEIVNVYKYLGILFRFNLKWELAISTLAMQAKKALNVLYIYDKVCKGLPFKCAFGLFDKMIVPIILYGSEVWGYTYYKSIEEVQVNFCKHILGLPRNASNLAAVGDCGRYPLSVLANIRCIKYWLKIQAMPDGRYVKSCYKMLKNLDENSRRTWATCIKELLMKYGFGLVWMEQGVGDVNSFLASFKQRAIDMYKQEWYSMIHNQSKLSLYCTYKSMLEPERYIMCLPKPYVTAMARYRASCHKLEVELGRHQGVLLEKRLCRLCEKRNVVCIEDEYHFLLLCPSYRSEREMHFPGNLIVNVCFQSFIAIMSSNEFDLMYNLALYLVKAMKKRKELLENL